MKKIFVFILIFLIFLFSNAYVASKRNMKINEEEEIRGVYISYLEYLTYFQNNAVAINKAYINKMLDNIKSLNFNTIFLHVSPFSDSIYDSRIFPYSYTLSGEEGKNPGMDYLEYFIKESKKRNIKIHAWINPYRISNESDTSLLSKDNPAYTLIDSNAVKITDSGIYYNPASPKVIDLILKQVYEIISNYDIDGIHFDDYFYVDLEIDQENYQKYLTENGNISLLDYRLKITNTMIKNVYQLIKDYNPDILFSISPDGNIENNYKYHFADVKTWLLESGYVDIIMPQVYYGFENEYKPFKETLDAWHSLIQNDVKIVPVLAFYKVGLEDSNAGSGQDEWLQNDNLIARQINYSKTLKNYEGVTLFRYDFLFNTNLETEKTKLEIENMKFSFQKLEN